MKLTYSVTIEDLIQFNEYHSEHSPFLRRVRRSYQLYSPLTLLILLGCWGYIAKSWAYPIVGAAVAIVMAVVAPGRFRKKIRKTAERCYSEGGNKGMFGVHTLEILDTELQETSPTGKQSTLWTGIERVESTPTHGFIYVSSQAAHVVPRASVSEGDFDAFMAAVLARTTKPNP